MVERTPLAERKIEMNASLPWDTDTATATTTGDDMHARATSLATRAMEAAASQTVVDPADTDYGRAQASYQARLAEIRATSAREHLARNNARAAEAQQRKAERQARHEASNAAAQAEARQRKLDKAA